MRPSICSFAGRGNPLPITDDPRFAGAEWCGLLAAPTAAHVEQIEIRASSMPPPIGRSPAVVGEFLNDLEQQALRTAIAFGRAHGQHVSTWTGVWDSAISPFVTSPALDQRAVSGFRPSSPGQCRFLRRRSTTTPSANTARPMESTTPAGPCQTSARFPMANCEVPFWLDDLAGQTFAHRASRPTADPGDGDLEVGRRRVPISPPNSDLAASAGRLQQFLRQHNVRLSPARVDPHDVPPPSGGRSIRSRHRRAGGMSR